MSKYLNSDGIGIYQDADVMYPLSVVDGRLIVGTASNNKQVSFSADVQVVYSEHVYRLAEGGVEEMIQYSQSGGRAAVEAAIAQLASASGAVTIDFTPVTDKLQELIDLTQSESDETQELLNNPMIELVFDVVDSLDPQTILEYDITPNVEAGAIYTDPIFVNSYDDPTVNENAEWVVNGGVTQIKLIIQNNGTTVHAPRQIILQFKKSI